MTSTPFDAVPEPLRAALVQRGFTALSPVQEAVIDPALAGRDLRISSQTGSGKTVAIGLVLAELLDAPPGEGPRAVVVAPTRELAAQVKGELEWLFAGKGTRVVAVTGGTAVRTELGALSRGADIVVGTPGRLVDHLERGSLKVKNVGAVVLDEADQMFDLGFREELETIMGKLPLDRQTHLMSATFPREVLALADQYQRHPAFVAATRPGAPNTDIRHVVHVVRPNEREDALVNMLLLAPDERTLVFVRTRADAADVGDRLSALGFKASSLTGEMEQRDRTRTLDAFRSGALSILVATDVAARGIDVPEVTRVIHADPPGDSDAYTHRSGRTGRAGRKGTSVLMVPPAARERAMMLLRRAKVEAKWQPPPNEAEVLRAADLAVQSELTSDDADGVAREPRVRALAEQLVAMVDPVTLVERLLARAESKLPCRPRKITETTERAPVRPAERPRRGEHTEERPARGRFAEHAPAERPVRPREHAPEERPARPRTAERAPREEGPEGERPSRARAAGPGGAEFLPFHVNFGAEAGADPRRLLALVCRRGEIRGGDVGAIQIGPRASTFEVRASVASAFTEAVKKPDARDPRIRISPFVSKGATHTPFRRMRTGGPGGPRPGPNRRA